MMANSALNCRVLNIRKRLAEILDELEPICEQSPSEDLYEAARCVESALDALRASMYARNEED